MPDRREDQNLIIKQAIREAFGFETDEEVAKFREVLPVMVTMAEDWKAAVKFGKWLTGLATFISLGLGIWVELRKIFTRH